MSDGTTPEEDPTVAASGVGSLVRGVLRRIAVTLAIAMIAVTGVAIANLSRVQPPETHAASVGVNPPADPAVQAPPSTGDSAPDAAEARVDPDWAERVATLTGIPARAVIAYASADLTLDTEEPSCGIGWNTLAGIGSIESDHGRHGGATLGGDGYPEPAIRGIPLNGEGTAVIRDTDGGVWDGDTVWDRAVGPMQFIPDTWARWGADGSGDGHADPNQIDDAALAAARYLCASGPMTDAEGWRAAIFSYNHLDSYVDDIAVTANRYAASTH